MLAFAIISGMKVTNLCSGSKGNCTLLQAENTNIIIDVGISYKLLTELLVSFNLTADKINAILITHEHIDHVSGLATFIKNNPQVHIYVNSDVWQFLTSKYSACSGLDNVHYFNFYTPFSVGEFTVTPLQNMHDSVTCASFILGCGGGKVGIATDLGIITDRQIDYLKTCKVVFLESNHDLERLYNCRYPYLTKKRISSDKGHLSNQQCAKACIKLVSGQTKAIVLSHLSQHSNLPELAYNSVANALSMAGLEATILLAWQDKPSKSIIIK